MIINIPHTEDVIVKSDMTASYEMREWMERVSIEPARDTIVINSISDFATQTDTQIICDNKIYYIAASITTDKKLVLGKYTALIRGSLNVDVRWVYTGTESAIYGEDIYSFDHRLLSISAPNGAIYNITSSVPNTGLIRILETVNVGEDASTLAAEKYGTFHNIQTLLITGASASGSILGGLSLGVNDGITISGSISILDIQQFALLSFDSAYIGLDITGATITTAFEITNFVNIYLGGGVGIKGDRNSANLLAGGLAAIRDCEFIGAGTPLSGIDSKDVRYSFSNCYPVPNSTVKGILQFDNSALVTTMVSAGTPTHINAEWNDGLVEERIYFFDKLTFDNTTNVCTTANGTVDTSGGTPFNHNFTAGDIILLAENGGLPSGLTAGIEYYVGNLTATTFQLYPDATLTTPVSFTTNGTEPNYYQHRTGTSKSGWFVYVGEQDVSLDIGGWVSIEKVSGPNVDIRTVIMKTDASYTITENSNGAKVNAKNGITGASQVTDIIEFSQNEGFMIYVENITGTINNVVTDARIICSLS